MTAQRITAIIFGALMSGLVAFSAIAAALVSSGTMAPAIKGADAAVQPDAAAGASAGSTGSTAPAALAPTGRLSKVQVLAIVAVSLTLAAVPVAFLLRARLLLRSATPAHMRWQAAHIAAGAVLEGVGFASAVFALLTGQLAFLAGAALMLVSMAVLFPTPGRAELWMAEESQLHP